MVDKKVMLLSESKMDNKKEQYLEVRMDIRRDIEMEPLMDCWLEV